MSKKRGGRGPWYETEEAAIQVERERNRLAMVDHLRCNPGRHKADDIAAATGSSAGAVIRLAMSSPAYFVVHQMPRLRKITEASDIELHPHLAAHL